MAHFAELDENNIVVNVVVVDNSVLDSKDEEQSGIHFLKSLYGDDKTWKQTSYNNSFRKCYAGIGYSYDPILDEFTAPIEEPTIYEEKISS